MSKTISFSYHHNMKKFNIKPRTEIINAGSDASYIKSDTIRFSSTYKKISSVEQLYFSINKNDDTIWLSSIVRKLCPTLLSEYNDFIIQKCIS